MQSLTFKKAGYLIAIFLFVNACRQPSPGENGSISEPAGNSISDGSVLPFPEPPSASTYGESILESKHVRRTYPSHLPANSPNIIIVLMDDVGFGSPSTFGGEINTPVLSKVYSEGIAYNEFHTTAICSPTQGSIVNRQEPYQGGQWNHCRTSRRLGWLYRNHSKRSRYCCRSIERIMVIVLLLLVNGIILRQTKPQHKAHLNTGRIIMVFNISMASWRAKLRNGNQGWWKISLR